MSTSASKRRKVKFFELAVHSPDGMDVVAPCVDWANMLRNADESDHRVPGDNEVEYVFGPRGKRSIIIAKRVPDLDAQAVDSSSLEIKPIKLENVDDFFARANYATFYDSNAFGMLGAMAGAPTCKAVAAIANALHPLEKGKWEARPLIVKGDIEAFQRASEARSVSFVGDVLPSGLFSEDARLSSSMRDIADALQSTIHVNVKIDIPSPKRSYVGMRNLKRLLDKEKVPDNANKVEATIMDGDVASVVELLEHDLATSIELPLDATNRIEESALVETLERAVYEKEDDIIRAMNIVRG